MTSNSQSSFIPIWIWWMGSIVVVDDVSPIVTACNGQVVRY